MTARPIDDMGRCIDVPSRRILRNLVARLLRRRAS